MESEFNRKSPDVVYCGGSSTIHLSVFWWWWWFWWWWQKCCQLNIMEIKIVLTAWKGANWNAKLISQLLPSPCLTIKCFQPFCCYFFDAKYSMPWASLVAQLVESACQYKSCRRHGFDPWIRKITWRRKWQPTPIFLSGKFCGQRILASYSPWGLKESYITVDLKNSHSLEVEHYVLFGGNF